jgi:hypothetical protein
MILPVGFGSSAGGTPANAISRSLRFNNPTDTAYLNRTFSSGNRATWTWSAWVKRSFLDSTATSAAFQTMFHAGTYTTIAFTADTIYFQMANGAGGAWYIQTSQVFRDVSAWYHIVAVLDTPSATASQRMRLYINGVEVTAFSTDQRSSITQNSTAGEINSNIAHALGSNTTPARYFPGYMTEINFIDGLTPNTTTRTVSGVTQTILTELGQFNTNTGVWEPAAWTRAFGTNGFYLPMQTSSANWGVYFDGTGDYLTVPSSANLQLVSNTFTVEFWFYRTTSATTGAIFVLNSGSSYGALRVQRDTATTISVYLSNNGSSWANQITNIGNFAQNTWNHVAITRDGSTGAITIFQNGTSIGTGTNASALVAGTVNYINAIQSGGSPVAGDAKYISNFRVVIGTNVYPSAFTPPTSPLTAITNTKLLTCQSSTIIDNSTNAFNITVSGNSVAQQFSPFIPDVTDDQSGNNNNWNPNNLNLVTTGVGADILVDSPTAYGTDTGVGGEVRGNYCTLNAVKPVTNSITFSNGNLQYKPGSSWSTTTYVEGTIGVIGGSTGKYYWEMSADQTGNLWTAGVALQNNTVSGNNIGTTGSVMIYDNSKYVNGTATGSYLTQLSANEVLGIALDVATGKVWFRDSGGWLGSGDPAAGTNETGIPTGFSNATLVPVTQANSASTVTANFGQRAFAYTAPSGFKALCTQNLDTPVIGATSTTQANKYFNTILYNGNGNTGQTVTGVGFQPDWVWLKNRNTSGGYYHCLFDAVRGAGQRIRSDSTAAEVNASAIFSAFTSDGFTFPAGQGNTIENDGNPVGNYVAWNWKANGAGSTNSNGTAKSSAVTVDSSTDTVTWNSHGMSDGQKIGFFASVMPGGLSAGTLYFVRDASTNTFKVAATSGGAAIDITSNGTSVTCHTTLTSTVSANTTSEFSIVTYTGTGANTTVEHGLDIAPTFIITKRRNGVVGWPCLVKTANSGNGQNGRLNLNETANYADNVEFWNNTSPTSKVFSIGISVGTNASGATMVAYCFAPVAGYSAFGSYVGNAAADGPFIYTGFRPEYVLIKASTSTGDWIIEDTVRSPYNVSTNYLVANTTGIETTGQLIDFLSNGFKIRVAVSSAMNGSGTTYIYAAFAENPFKYSLAR